MAETRWLLLAYQLPTRLSNARVKTWRRLQQLGAVPTRNSVYVLPNTEQCREDFEWMRGEIVALGGEATVFAADCVSPDGGHEVVRAFQRARDADYESLKRTAEQLLTSSRAKGAAAKPAKPGRWPRMIRLLRQRLAGLEQIDFFPGPVRQRAAEALAELERRVTQAAKPRLPSHLPRQQTTADFQGRRWVTRPRPGVDRMASAWLIRRFIDPGASFAFVKQAEPSEVSFDMYDGDFSHRGPLCTFEVLVETFRIARPSVARIGHIVHDLDMKETRYAPPEAPAVSRMIDGLRQLHADDRTLLEHGIAMFEALARSFDSTGDAGQRRAKSGAGRARKRPTTAHK
jgi:hypothetical protein